MIQKKIEYENTNIIDSFDDSEKRELFDDLSEMYFKKNFGSLSKSDLETYLFSFYIEHLLNTKKDIDDYVIGRDLGLTISRVRALKERKELKYPHIGYDWKDEFLKYAENARYDDKNNLIKFSIPDVNVLKDARYFFEKNNEYDEYQLNPKLFQCPLDSFIKIGQLLADEKGEKFEPKIRNIDIKKIEEQKVISVDEKNALDKITQGLVTEGLRELLKNGTKEIIVEVLKLFIPGAGVINSIFRILINTLNR